ncbi:MAG TPA: ABC transporter permease [Phototrophicaceae bacterium]|nr:ABC transporter permease [Phototrophicaceae bacterium]
MIDFLNTYSRQLRIGAMILGILLVLLILFGLPVTLLQSSIRLSTPYVLGALAALVASRAGVLNLAIEGKMLLGAFIAVVVVYQPGVVPAEGRNPLLGVLAAALSGGVLGLIFAVLYLRIRINLVILALAVNLFVTNATVFFMRVSFGSFGTLADPSIRSLPTLQLPFIHNIPWLGPLLSGYQVVVYLGWVMVALVWVLLFRTQFGRHIRAVGQNREAAESVGINVTRVQIFALTLSGMLAGMAGSFLSLGILSQFVEGMTNGRGWTSITISLFAFEQPVGAFITALFFGLAEALSFYLQSRPEVNLPPDLLLALPQIVTIAALVLVALRIRAAELMKRRNFAQQFGQELDKLRRGVLVGGPD